ncbi:IS3 family transposase [Terrisporobacter vanillatitrophus]|uniref:IS3 family transposase n=1 Tax=Terrisporobacter vanillatitrophus TaxID=3058402 RepID=UPI003242894A
MIVSSFKKETIYIAIRELNAQGYPILILCNFAGIARSSYYKWLNRKETSTDKDNSIILKEIVRIYDEVDGIYGYRRMAMNVNRSFWGGIIKSEMYYLKKFHNFDELKLAIDNYIEFYNNRRLQKKLKGLSLIEYRTQTF